MELSLDRFGAASARHHGEGVIWFGRRVVGTALHCGFKQLSSKTGCRLGPPNMRARLRRFMGGPARYRVWPTVAPLTTVKHLGANLEQTPILSQGNNLFTALHPHKSAIRFRNQSDRAFIATLNPAPAITTINSINVKPCCLLITHALLGVPPHRARRTCKACEIKRRELPRRLATGTTRSNDP